LTCGPIELFPATSQADKTRFHQINTSTRHRLPKQMVDEQTGRVVDTEQKGRGYEISKGRYVPIGDDELKVIEIESTHMVDWLRAEGRNRQALPRRTLLRRPGARLGRTHSPSSVML
jgi:non-homologous end joining protein Ku